MFTILMVCTGNTCRSPMAAAFFQDIINKFGYGGKMVAVSAGVSAFREPASKNTMLVMAKRGLDLKGHLSKQLTENQISDADLILAMTKLHKQKILAISPHAADKVFTLKEFAAGNDTADISDPFGADEERYEACAVQINALLDKSREKIVALFEGNTK
jgi:protein-tyrosine phosphatase